MVNKYKIILKFDSFLVIHINQIYCFQGILLFQCNDHFGQKQIIKERNMGGCCSKKKINPVNIKIVFCFKFN